MELSGKVALITGASRGIGRALALRLASRGMKVVVAAKTMDPDPRLPGTLRETVEAIEAAGGEALAVQTDVRIGSALEALVRAAEECFGGVDVLVNNAGALYWHPIAETPATRFDLVMQVNARAAFLLSRACIPHFVRRGGGVVINMSPPIVPAAAAGHTAYMISKFGMTLVTAGLAAEHAADGVRAYSLWPVTLIESQATIGHALGTPEMWRKADIVVDAAEALIDGRAAVESGSASYDEDVLRSVGVDDFARYACVPGASPPAFRLESITEPAMLGRAGRLSSR